MDVGHSQAPKEVSGQKIYDLDDSVVVWSDFLKPHLHPKTLEVIRNYQHNKLVRVSSSLSIYQQGALVSVSSLLSSRHFFIAVLSDMVRKLRNSLAEEADVIHSVTCLTNTLSYISVVKP